MEKGQRLGTTEVSLPPVSQGPPQRWLKPLVIAGGICPTFNPEPLADFVDAFVIGDAEPVLPRITGSVAKGRSECIKELSETPGIYVPALRGQAAVTRVAADLEEYPCSSVISTPEAEFGDIRLIEVARGCARGCRFCVAGFATRPPRPRRALDVLDGRRYGLVGAAVFDHASTISLCRRMVERDIEFTVSSLRLETVTPEVACLLAAGGQKTLTIAPEAGAQRLRRLINNSVDEEKVFQAVANAHNAGIGRVKLYFMVGLPTETDDEARQIAAMALRLADAFPQTVFHVSVSCFVPKPWTPFQWSPMERQSVLKRRIASIRKALTGSRRIEFSAESPRLAAVQGLLARGDRKAGRILAAALENGGDYQSAIRETGIDAASYVSRVRGRSELLPWDHIRVFEDKDTLWNEYQAALGEL